MWLRVESGDRQGESIEVTGRQFLIGRDSDCDFVIDDDRISRQHARLAALDSGGLVVTDLGSSNGTYVDDRRITEPVTLKGGERIRVGHAVLSVGRGAPAGTTRIESPAPPPVPSGAPARPQAAPIPQAPRAQARAGPAPPPPGPTPSVVERLKLRASVRRSTIIAAVAVALVALLVILFATGVLDRKSDSTSTADVAKDAAPSTTLILALVGDEVRATGSGWVLDADQGLIVTNQHVVNAGTTFAVGVGNDQRDARIVASAPCDDLAVLRVQNTKDLKTLPLGSQGDLNRGDKVVALGFPGNASLGADLQTSDGIVSVVKTRVDLTPADIPLLSNVVQTTAPINAGNSGGPLVDTHRRLVGVNSATSPAQENQAYAIGVDRVKEVVATLRAGTSIAWSGIGFDFLEGDERAAALTGAGFPAGAPGLLATRAVARTDASAVNFGKTPVLVQSVGGKPMDGTLRTYCEAARDLRSHDRLDLTVIVPGNGVPQAVKLAVP
jgi:S1-C subfamily serine protease